jgi:hypothetical protein
MQDAPESIARSDEDPEAILDEPEADFRQVGALAHAVDADEGNTKRHTSLRRRKRRRQFFPDGKQHVCRRFGGQYMSD